MLSLIVIFATVILIGYILYKNNKSAQELADEAGAQVEADGITLKTDINLAATTIKTDEAKAVTLTEAEIEKIKQLKK